MILLHAPEPVPSLYDVPMVFLAGTIEMGNSIDWQSELATFLGALDSDCIVLNPRRPDWDSSWEQRADHPQFREQVEWELDGLDRADVIPIVFLAGSVSPISLLELGLMAATSARKLIVFCEEGFQRKGNVDIVCQRYGVRQVDTFRQLSILTAIAVKSLYSPADF